MRVLVFEHLTGGGLEREALSPSLLREGEAMVRALAADLLDIPGVHVGLVRDARLMPLVPLLEHSRLCVIPIDSAGALETRLRTLLRDHDAFWPIAPEFDGILERLCRMAEQENRILLTSPSRAVALAASKLATHDRLRNEGIPVVRTVPADRADELPFPRVLKRDDGVGCLDTHIANNEASWSEHLGRASSSLRWVAQPFLSGSSLSLCALFHRGKGLLLSVNAQHVRQACGGFEWLGCTVNRFDDCGGRFQALVDRVARACPELWGYAGIDLLESNEGEARVLEINPRVTTSYAGLRRALGINVAERVLELQRTGILSPLFHGPSRPIELSVENFLGY
jgi:predicted ATP-grasp superfamily ATP-dependent carboligase